MQASFPLVKQSISSRVALQRSAPAAQDANSIVLRRRLNLCHVGQHGKTVRSPPLAQSFRNTQEWLRSPSATQPPGNAQALMVAIPSRSFLTGA
jgi:hypothetical protein